jgi:L-arabinonolactonase
MPGAAPAHAFIGWPGHCLGWDDAGRSWWWADGNGKELRTWPHDGAGERRFRLPDEGVPFARCLSGRLLLCGPKRLFFGSPPSRGGERRQRWALDCVSPVDPAEPRTWIHEGRTDRHGFFVFGTRNDGIDGRPIGSFFQYSRHRGLRRLALPTVTVATSICFSVDGRRLYFADGVHPRILQCEYDPDQALTANVREFVRTGALPGASVIDREGNLWNVQGGAGRVVQYGPQGEILRTYSLQKSGPATPAFGGPALDRLLLAGAFGVIELPDAGAIGVPDAPFDDR